MEKECLSLRVWPEESMLTYRNHIYSLAMAVLAEAANLTVALTRCELAMFDTSVEDARLVAASLQTAASEFWSAIPEEVRTNCQGRHHMSRHLHWIDHWLSRNTPGSCMGDPVDIAEADIPAVLRCFDEWCHRQSPQDLDLSKRLEPHIKAGQLNAAVREAWAIFKTRMVTMFNLPSTLDGHKLAEELFGTGGAMAETLGSSEREGYLNLFKGLYSLIRNPIAHNDLPPNPDETEAVIALVNSAIVKVERAHQLAASGTASA